MLKPFTGGGVKLQPKTIPHKFKNLSLMHKPYNEYSVRNWSRSHTHQYMKSGKHIQIMYIKVFVTVRPLILSTVHMCLTLYLSIKPIEKRKFHVNPILFKNIYLSPI